MTNDPQTNTPLGALVPTAEPNPAAERWMGELSSLLRELENVVGVGSTVPPVIDAHTDNQLVQVRLGVASSLFAALQCKHAPTATHSMRVALTCSAWALQMGLGEEQRDAVEIAALLHDVGMIGTPDRILLKPLPLTEDEAAVMARSRQMSLDILRPSCSKPEVLEIVEHTSAWYDGSRKGFERQGRDLPLGARMIAIVEAFDAMTTDHVFRPSLTHERAMGELFECAGTQFDPELVDSFSSFQRSDRHSLHAEVAARWLEALDPELANRAWELSGEAATRTMPAADSLFQGKLLENMYDAVVFLDAHGRITLWNRGAERLTGISGDSVRHRRWYPELLDMADERGQPISEADCPVNSAIDSGVQSLRRLSISGRNGRAVAVDSHAMPVIGDDGTSLGAILLFHDASSETTLEQRCQNLHEKATRDPLTQVANRAEFDRVHQMFVVTHQEQQMPCSLIIMDLDRFKSVNDTYGHQAGDQALISLASILKSSCRSGDLVARYGGEEFVMLCANCDNTTAARRAEEVRVALAQMPQPALDGRPVTASFGVTEIQPGDTAETMLRRADRGLLMAKTQGRNQVVQLGTGSAVKDLATRLAGASSEAETLLERTLVSSVPIRIAIEKLRGFVADHEAKIVKTDGNRVELTIDDDADRQRRYDDRPIRFRMTLRFKEQRDRTKDETSQSRPVQTRIFVSITPLKNRDRRRANIAGRARDVLISFQSYLMATEVEGGAEETHQPVDGRSWIARLLGCWLNFNGPADR